MFSCRYGFTGLVRFFTGVQSFQKVFEPLKTIDPTLDPKLKLQTLSPAKMSKTLKPSQGF